MLKPIDFVATLLEGKVKYQKLPSGNSDYIEFYDKNGEMVATYSNNGWTMYTTNAEASRLHFPKRFLSLLYYGFRLC